MVCRVLASGRGVLLTTTRDGGAVGIHLYEGDSRASDFVSNAEELEAVIQAIHERIDPRKGQGPVDAYKAGLRPA